MDFNSLLVIRQSTRKFQDRQIDPQLLDAIIRAANSAPIGSNLYKDIHITVVQDKSKLLYLCEAAWKRFSSGEKVKEIAGDTVGKDRPSHLNLFYGSPAVFFLSHRKQTIQPGIEWANVMSVGSIMHLEATNIGLGSVFMWGALESMRMFPELDHTAVLDLPQDFQPLIGLAVGYPVQSLEKNMKKHAPISVNYVA